MNSEEENEPVTAEWCEEQGFEVFVEDKPLGYTLPVASDSPAYPVRWYSAECICAAGRVIIQNPTRGQLTHLLEALGGNDDD